ncbi:MAG: HAMP domain-containing protein [Gammaproteobacteria bacterium]|jgi:two-component system osmolarity sensor histidine kinase EnvZ|nr:HAMP domain-containing protein [Gammaproteobacteria bacterium]
MKLPNSLFFRTATTLTIASLVLVGITMASLARFVVIPVSKQSADDLAALLILSAQTWVELPPQTRPFFEHELLEIHQLKLIHTPVTLTPLKQLNPYLDFLEEAIEHRLGNPVTIGYNQEHSDSIEVDIPMAEHKLHFSFPADRVGARPPFALLSISIAILLLAIITALILALRLSRPLAVLSAATTVVGRGKKQLALPETGPDEIINLSQKFNHMAREVAELLENRTTLLAGISHDLRTPLTRLKLTLELMPESVESEFRQSLTEDIDEIEHRLREVLQLARGVEQQEQAQELDLGKLIIEVISGHQHDGAQIHYDPVTPVVHSVPRETLKRILNNLLENAVRYGEQKPISVQLQQEINGQPRICIFDQGPGIPEEE